MKIKRKCSGFHSKKGNVVADGVLIVVVLFVFVMFIILGYQISTDLNTEIQASTDLNETSKVLYSNMHNMFPDLFDAGFMLALILLWAITLAFAYFVDSHPIFVFFTFILIIALGFVGALLGNSFEEFILDDSISTAASAFPMSNFVMTHLLETILAIAFSALIVMFAKIRGAG